MDEWEGFRFCPPEDVTVGCHLHCKLTGKKLLANEFIKEINIYNFDPWELQSQSKVKLRDFVWYFFTLVENNPENGDGQNRKTSSGFWKITGNPKPIYDRWGRWSKDRGEIGYKRVLSFHKGSTRNVGKADWVMHEFHNTMLPPNLRTHVICRVEYKGNDNTFIFDNATEPSPAFVQHLTNSANSGSVVDQSVQRNWGAANNLSEYDPANQMDQSVQENWGFSNHLCEYNPANQMQYNPANQIQHLSGNFNTQEVHFASIDFEIPMLPDKDLVEIFNLVFNNGEPNSYTYMQENCNEHRPKDPVTRVFDDYNSDSDNESSLYGDTASSMDSVGNPSELCSTPIPPLNSIDQLPTTELQTFSYESSEEVKKELQGKEKVKNEWEMKMAEDPCIKKTPATKRSWCVVEDGKIEKKTHRTPKWIYLRTIIFAVFLLFSIIASTSLLLLLLGARVVASAAAISPTEEKKAWLLLAWVSTVAGNLRLLGSAANLIVCEQARRATHHGYTLTFTKHLKFDLPSTLIVTFIGLFLVK